MTVNGKTYAFWMVKKPDGTLFEGNVGNEPGLLCGNEAFVERLIKEDMKTVGLNFDEYKEGMTGGVRVALFIAPYYDYHWYVYDDVADVWYHKLGSENEVTNCKATMDFQSGITYYDNTILLEGEKGYELSDNELRGYEYVGEFYIW